MICWSKLAETIFYFLTNQDLLHVPENNDPDLGFGVNFIAMHLYVVLIGATTQYMLFLKLDSLKKLHFTAAN
jgi:hypothetical protein